MLARTCLATAAVSVGLLACVTEPVCGCSEPGSFVIVYGTIRSADGGAGAGATVVVTIAEPAPVAGACSFGVPGVDSPAAVAADGAGRYRVTVLSQARDRKCLRVRAGHSPDLLGEAVLLRTFPPPGETDSVQVDIALRVR